MSTVLEKPFKKMGAKVEVRVVAPSTRFSFANMANPIALDVKKDQDGKEYFDIAVRDAKSELAVLEVQPKDRHLVLMVKSPGTKERLPLKQKFLCGHDERHWFVAAIPESAGVTTVKQAKAALKPEPVLRRELMVRLGEKHKSKRKTTAWKRQGEWFFVPVDLAVDGLVIMKNEPFNRGRGKFHYAEEAYRAGGRQVFVKGTKILDPTAFEAVRASGDSAGWRAMMADAQMYVRGKISHSDHATIVLDGWHEVLMNTEAKAMAMRNVTFLD